jgi:hypothetical protein
MAVKAVIPRYFSIVVFGLTQITLDLEAAWHMSRHEYPFHTFWHTYFGASLVAVGLTVLGKPASQWVKTAWNCIAAKCHYAILTVSTPTTWTASFSGAMIGTYSHILLDSLFHPDMEPLQPWSPANRFHGVVEPHGIELLCIVLGVVGLVWFFGRESKIKNADKASHATSEPLAGADSSAREDSTLND